MADGLRSIFPNLSQHGSGMLTLGVRSFKDKAKPVRRRPVLMKALLADKMHEPEARPLKEPEKSDSKTEQDNQPNRQTSFHRIASSALNPWEPSESQSRTGALFQEPTVWPCLPRPPGVHCARR